MTNPETSSRIDDRLVAGHTVSFEFFPPKTDVGVRKLEQTIAEMAELAPDFVSVTYGAGGSTRDRTRDLVVSVDHQQPFPAMPHLTCMGHTRDEITALLSDYAGQGIANVLALAGDPPTDGTPPSGDFRYAAELIELVREQTDFAIGVAAHPELHPRSPDRDTDRRHLADKLGLADFGITQFFFDIEHYRRLMDDLAGLGVDTPILAGVIPVTNPASIRRFAVMNGAAVPEELWARLEAADEADGLAIAVDAAAELCQQLIAEGAPGLHFYTLNQAAATQQVLAQL